MVFSRYGYYSNFGPLTGPAHHKDRLPAMGVHLETDASDRPAGIAYPNGWVEDEDIDGRPSIQTFRLTIGKTEMPERYMLLGRRFVPESEWPGVRQSEGLAGNDGEPLGQRENRSPRPHV